jgi:membrane fusion protein (multidrug efflux system)
MWRIPMLVLCLVPLCGCGDGQSDAAPAESAPPVPVHVEKVRADPGGKVIVVSGIVEAASRIELAFRVEGFVDRFHVDEGDRVEAGAVIAELDRDVIEREVRLGRATHERASAEAEQAGRVFERQRKLLASDTASRQSYDEAESDLRMAEAASTEAGLRLESAEDRLEKTRLVAPINGYVEQRLCEEHEVAAPGAPVIVLTELDEVKVRAAVADSALHLLQIGAAVRVLTPAWPGRDFTGRIERIAVAADHTTRTIPFEVTLPNDDLALRPEMVVEVEITEDRDGTRYSVPLTTVLRGPDLVPFCYVVKEGSDSANAEQRAVGLGDVVGDRIEILSGLDPADLVVTRGHHFLTAGEPIRIIERAQPAAGSEAAPGGA